MKIKLKEVKKLPSHRKDHISENVKRELVSIIRGLNDPRVTENFIDIVKIEVSKDISVCEVYISSLDGITKANEAVEGLNSAVFYIKRELGKRIRLRFIPDLRFRPTDSIEYSMDMLGKINNLSAV